MRVEDCCALCYYCREIDLKLTDPSGVCKIFPPSSSYDQVMEETIVLPQPPVELTGWCGCFKRVQES